MVNLRPALFAKNPSAKSGNESKNSLCLKHEFSNISTLILSGGISGFMFLILSHILGIFNLKQFLHLLTKK